MMNAVTLFIFTLIVSFLGSLQLGPVNLSVIKAVLSSNIHQAKLIAFGGVIPELIYSLLALQVNSITAFSDAILKYRWVVGVLFVGIGFYYFFKVIKARMESDLKGIKVGGFISGFFLALFNFQLLPFWIGVTISVNNSSFFSLNNTVDKFCFIFGSAVGAYLLLSLFIYLTRKYKNMVLIFLEKFNLNKVYGLLFIILGLVQFI